MNRLQQALKINAAFDHYYATSESPDEFGQFSTIYHALLEIDELINAAESEQLDEEDYNEIYGDGLDEEVEIEVTPVDSHSYHYSFSDTTWQNANPAEVLPYVGMADEFSEFSPSVGTTEATRALAEMVAPMFGGHLRGITGTGDIEQLIQPTTTEYDRFVGRAPVGERVYTTVHNPLPMQPTSVPAWPEGESVHVPFKGVRQTIAEAFSPCGAD